MVVSMASVRDWNCAALADVVEELDQMRQWAPEAVDLPEALLQKFPGLESGSILAQIAVDGGFGEAVVAHQVFDERAAFPFGAQLAHIASG